MRKREYEEKIKELEEELRELKMEKLCNLLHEYCRPCWFDQIDFETDLKYRVVSRKRGFIKWLLENNKIDIEKVDNYVENELRDFNGVGDEEEVLMILALQSDPIEYLLDILK